VVTATRLPATLSQAPDVQVVTGEEIALRQATFAFDVLATVPGVQISRTGDFGGVTSLRIRGASSDKTLVLLDGADVNDPTSPAGGFDFASLDLAEVDRIEILSGPQGSLWGSDAIGGVVSITTREPDGLRAASEGGSFGTVRANGSAGLADDRKAIGASVAWFGTDGISKADARDGNTERDGFHSFTAQGNGRIALGEAVTLDAKVRYNKAYAAFDSFGGPTGVIDGPDSQDGWMVSGFLRARIKGPLGFTHELRADGMQMDRVSNSFFGGSLFPFEAKGKRLDMRWTAERTDLGPSAVLVGVERQADHEDTGDGGQSARNWAGFAVWRFTPIERLTTTVSLRRDEPRDYKGVTTVRATAALGLGAGFTVTGAWGQGFKAPSIFQRTYPCFECIPPGPSPNLKPERAEGWDATLSWRSADGRFSGRATGYGLTVRDQIDYQFPHGYLNIDRARTTGVEAEARAELGAGFSVAANYAYAHARDVSTGLPLLRVPAHSASGELAWRSSRADAVLTVRGQSRASDVFGDIKPFAVADLAASYALTKHMRLTGRIENVTDAHYQQAFGYGEPGFGVFVGVRLTP
jgi:vitamin B12 transporter